MFSASELTLALLSGYLLVVAVAFVAAPRAIKYRKRH